jgi:hypothetical protein
VEQWAEACVAVAVWAQACVAVRLEPSVVGVASRCLQAVGACPHLRVDFRASRPVSDGLLPREAAVWAQARLGAERALRERSPVPVVRISAVGRSEVKLDQAVLLRVVVLALLLGRGRISVGIARDFSRAREITRPNAPHSAVARRVA